jgi:hypothetical protein
VVIIVLPEMDGFSSGAIRKPARAEYRREIWTAEVER